ncbi:hypothetical protein CEP88_00450 (plasmid) [Roseobacter denitrificans]|nr:hypothetical protein CEP88_00450 [Roseobacter denitrificans]
MIAAAGLVIGWLQLESDKSLYDISEESIQSTDDLNDAITALTQVVREQDVIIDPDGLETLNEKLTELSSTLAQGTGDELTASSIGRVFEGVHRVPYQETILLTASNGESKPFRFDDAEERRGLAIFQIDGNKRTTTEGRIQSLKFGSADCELLFVKIDAAATPPILDIRLTCDE